MKTTHLRPWKALPDDCPCRWWSYSLTLPTDPWCSWSKLSTRQTRTRKTQSKDPKRSIWSCHFEFSRQSRRLRNPRISLHNRKLELNPKWCKLLAERLWSLLTWRMKLWNWKCFGQGNVGLNFGLILLMMTYDTIFLIRYIEWINVNSKPKLSQRNYKDSLHKIIPE